MQSVCVGPVSLPRGDQCPVSCHLDNKDGKMNNENLFLGKKGESSFFYPCLQLQKVFLKGNGETIGKKIVKEKKYV